MRRAEIAGFWAESYEILQAMATETSSFYRCINHFAVVQAGLFTAIATAFGWPTRTTSFRPRVTPV